MIRYPVSYIATDADRTFYGSLELQRSEPIASMQDVDEAAGCLREYTGLPSANVLSFSVFAEPGEAGAR